MTGSDGRRERVGTVVAGVVAAAVREARAAGIALLEDGSPEARLAAEWCRLAVGGDAMEAITPPEELELDPGLQRLLGSGGTPAEAARVRAEMARAVTRTLAARRGLLLAGSANKTALLLTPIGDAGGEPLLPLGDLWASQVRELAGGWTAPDRVRELAEGAGGVEVLDAALSAWADRRLPLESALRELPLPLRDRVAAAVAEARFARRRTGLVPKLGGRTLGIDLFA